MQSRKRSATVHFPEVNIGIIMAKSERKGGKKTRKPKKVTPAKANASQPSLKGTASPGKKG